MGRPQHFWFEVLAGIHLDVLSLAGAMLSSSTDAMETRRKAPVVDASRWRRSLDDIHVVINQGSQEQQCSSHWRSYRFHLRRQVAFDEPCHVWLFQWTIRTAMARMAAFR